MASIKTSSRFFCLLLLISKPLFAQNSQSSSVLKLETLKTKQNLSSIRYISSDGKYTYYQNSQGDLLLEKNYKIFQVLKNKPGTDYNIFHSSYSKYLVIQQDNHFLSAQSLRSSKLLYYLPYGSDQARKISLDGLCPKLINQDKYISIYQAHKSQLAIYSIKLGKFEYFIKLYNKSQNYSCPEVEMNANKDIFYVDRNSQNELGLMHYNSKTKSTKLIIKKELRYKIELCSINQDIVVGLFPRKPRNLDSFLYKIAEEKNSYVLSKTIYSSKQTDQFLPIGNMLCHKDGNIYFLAKQQVIKSTSSKTASLASVKNSIIVYNYNQEKVGETINVQNKNIQQLIPMDKRILVSDKGEIYILKGSKETYKDIPMNNSEDSK